MDTTVCRTFFLSLTGELVSISGEDERRGGGGMFSDRSAAQHLLHRLRASLGWPDSGPGGQSQEGPGAGPDAVG